tara:strand:- start:253 stop:366 length:114 start_codon:yes stop_codon:yes gene_type:complete
MKYEVTVTAIIEADNEEEAKDALFLLVGAKYDCKIEE